MIRPGKRLVHVAAVLAHGVADVAVELFTRQRRAGLERFFRVRNAGQRLVFDVNRIGGVLRLRSRTRNHRGHRHAGAVYRAARQHRMGRNLHFGSTCEGARLSFLLKSLPVITASTPGIAFALPVSIEIIFA